MTIHVQVKNDDAARTVEVVEVAIDKASGRRTDGTVTKLEPGESRGFDIYMLRDLIVREVDPVRG
jgi:hypothetical protein